ncbi:MAG: hypothetical protein JKY54_18275 [Flavobacteriales bacterium]|nr:hypothetical protein [Flavobacteriales bacterium]
MKNLFIIILLIALVGENVYIYIQPDTVCDLIKKKGDELKDKVFSSEMVQKEIEETKQEAMEDLKAELKAEMSAKIDSMFSSK